MILNIGEKTNYKDIGNKGKNLSFLKSEGFNIPSGVILDKNVYEEILSENKIDKKLEKILDNLSLCKIDKNVEEIIKLFDCINIPKTILEEIENRISKDKVYAVRSSGNKEDLEDFSFAGQYESVLNVKGIEKIKDAIITCYKSVFSKNILTYLINNKINYKELKMSIIIQEMVNAEKSGVAFTSNPITANDREIIIEIGEGLGERLVSGEITPETYSYDWFEEKYSYKDTNTLLTKDELKNLITVLLEIQKKSGYPCDIEFAFENGELYILQLRSITKILYSNIKGVWTNANFKDGGVASTECTALMWSLYEYIWEKTLKEYLVAMKLFNEDELPKLSNIFFSRPYWNLEVVKAAMMKIIGYKEREFDEDLGVTINYQGVGNKTKINLANIIKLPQVAVAHKKILKDRKNNLIEYKNELLSKYNQYFYDLNREYSLEELEEVCYRLLKDDYYFSENTYFSQIFINTVEQTLFKQKMSRYTNNEEYINLITALEDISHLRPYYALWNLSRKIKENSEAFNYWNGRTVKEIITEYKLGKASSYLEGFRNYINEYGYHSHKELDISYYCFYEDITSSIEELKKLILLGEEFSPEISKGKQEGIYNTQLENLKNKFGTIKFGFIKKSVEDMRNLLWWREEFKDISTRFYFVIRMYMKKLGKLYYEKDILKNEEYIWNLKINDILMFIDKSITKEELNSKGEKNNIYRNSFRNFVPENELGIKADENSDKVLSDASIIGVGCNTGEIIGIARILESADEMERVKKGEILITKFISTGWTSKFSTIGGLVTETGGILCHGSIIAREYGIPCIVSAKNVITKVKDGDKIRINGSTGEIQILD